MGIRLETEKRLKGRTARLLRQLGIAECDVNPKPIGRGYGHTVYTYFDNQQVVKVPYTTKIDKPIHQLQNEVDILQTYFQEAYVPTTILHNRRKHCIVMDRVLGDHVYADEVRQSEGLRVNLIKLAEANQKYIAETGNMVDFVGYGGILAVVFLRNPHLSNVLHNNENIHLIDNDILDLNHPNPFTRLNRRTMLAINSYVLQKHFGITFKPKIPKRS